MTDETKPFSLRLDRPSEILLDGFAKQRRPQSRGQVVRDALLALAELNAAALVAEYETWKKLLEEVGDEDAAVVIFVEEVDGEPVVHITYSWATMPEWRGAGADQGDRRSRGRPGTHLLRLQRGRDPDIDQGRRRNRPYPVRAEPARPHSELAAEADRSDPAPARADGPPRLGPRPPGRQGREYLELLWKLADEQSDREQVEA